jgi:SAM-dependent methyltransferase
VRESLLEVLADPESHAPLELEQGGSSNGEVLEGTLRTADGRTYSVIRGIPRFIAIDDAGQQQTAETFGYKWQQRDSYDSPGFREFALRWFLERYGFESEDELRSFFRDRRLTLDAGCGAGFTASLWLESGWQADAEAQWVGLDISAAIDVARDRLGSVGGVHFVQGDVSRPPFRPGSFDAILSEGVLHHTPSTESAIRGLATALAPGGELLFYVYRKKGPIREFADDHIREVVSQMPPDEAWEALRPLTKLAQALAELEMTVDVPEDIPYLQIPAGKHDVQRLIYWHFLKLFWSPDLTFEENNHVNFDWYQPVYAHRQTEDDLRGWCANAGLEIFHLLEQESGFTVRARKA